MVKTGETLNLKMRKQGIMKGQYKVHGFTYTYTIPDTKIQVKVLRFKHSQHGVLKYNGNY